MTPSALRVSRQERTVSGETYYGSCSSVSNNLQESHARRSEREQPGRGRNRGWWNRQCPNYPTRIADGRPWCLGKEWRPRAFWYCRECSPNGARMSRQESSASLTHPGRQKTRW